MLDFIDKSKKIANKASTQAPVRWPWKAHQYARYLREIKGETWPSIEKLTGIPERTLKSWAEKEVWGTKGEEKHQIETWTRERFVELAAAKGMPKARAMELLVQGMEEPTETKITEEVDQDGKVVAKAVEKPDYNTRHKYQKEYWNLTGLNSNGKGLEINNNGQGTVNVQVNIPAKEE